MDILDFFNKFKNQKNAVGIFVSSKSSLEIVQFDIETMQIIKHGYTSLGYDLVSRQINNLQQFEAAINKLYAGLNISLGSPAILSLPTILMNHQTLPLGLGIQEQRTALISEAERNYIFRKKEPTVSWETITVNEDAGTQLLLFSAIQKDEVIQVEDIFKRSGINLVAIDSSYAALVRGLSLTGLVEDDVRDGTFWCIILITANSIVIISLVGNKIIEVSEDPIALKSLNLEDIYPTISSSLLEAIKTKNLDHVVIISETDDVSAEVLSTYFDLNSKISFVEENKFCKIPLFSGNIEVTPNKNAISLETVGSACWKKTDIPVNFNFSLKNSTGDSGHNINLFGISLDLTPQLLMYIIWGLTGASLVLFLAIYLICSSISGGLDKKIQDMSTRSSQLTQEIQGLNSSTQSTSPDIVTTVYEKNGKIIQSFNAIGGVIPEKLWIEHFELHNDMSTNIRGKAYSVEDVVNYYQNLARSARFNNFKISSIKVIGDSNESNNKDINIVPKKDDIPQASGLPKLPDLSTLPNIPVLSGKKYYEFVFGMPPSSGNAPNQAGSGISPFPNTLPPPTTP